MLQVLAELLHGPVHIEGAVRRTVGRKDHLFHIPQGAVRRQRLRIHGVQGGAADDALLERFYQRFGIHHRPACNVDEHAGGFHFGQLRRADHAPCGVGQGREDHHEVGGGQHRVQFRVGVDPVIVLQGRNGTLDAQYRHIHALAEPGHLAGDGARADDAHGQAGGFHKGDGGLVPHMLALLAQHGWEMPQK